MKKILLIAAIALTACGTSDPKVELDNLRTQYAALGEQIKALEAQIAASSGAVVDTKSVETLIVEPQDFARRVTVQGVVDGDEIITINPRASGEIVMLSAQVGQTVKAGTVLARIDDAILRKGLDELKTSYDLAKTVYERQAALWRDSIGSEIQYIQARNNKESIERRIASMNEQLAMYVIKAPISGTLEAVNIKLGQAVSPSMAAVVLINLNKLKVVAQASESYSSKVKRGDKVSVFFPDIAKSYELTISSVSNLIDTKNRTFTIEAKLPNGIEDVKANMLAKVAIESYKASNVISVPVNLILKSINGESLYIVSDEGGKLIARKRAVKTGVISDNSIEILEGLTAGDVIVTAGYQALEPGTELTKINK